MKKRKLLICILLLALATMLASACGGEKSAEQIARENGATVKITLDLAGGSSSGQSYRYLYIHENTPIALPWEEYGGKGIIYPPSYDEGYRLVGFYHGTKDEEGNITYGEEWKRSERFSEDTTLYARWAPRFAFRVLDAEGNLIKDFYVDVGEALDTRDSAAGKVEGYTFIAYYKDKDFQTPWDETFVHPGYPEGVDLETAEPEDYIVTLYADYVEGDYKKVYKPRDFTTAANYWLIGENGVLDFEGESFPVFNQFKGKIVGNGVIIKNAVITRENTSSENIGIFGKLSGASISDVTFENCSMTVKFTRRPQGVVAVKAGFLAGSAENTSLTNVTFTNCALTIDIAQGTGGDPVVPCEYEGTESPIWSNRDADVENKNSLQNVNGEVTLHVN